MCPSIIFEADAVTAAFGASDRDSAADTAGLAVTLRYW